ncbi:MAG: hypothetical protein AAGE84_29955 [Cyanobacteria bacterium P01_G01_bin.39]
MKTNTSGFAFSWFNSLMLAVAIVILAAVSTAKGKNNASAASVPSIPNNVINGLFTPTQADRFFQTGREDFEQEIKTFNHPQLDLGDDLLRFDPELIEQMQHHQPVTNFQSDHQQYELHPDGVNY